MKHRAMPWTRGGKVQSKLETFGEVRGLDSGEASEGVLVHELIQVVAQSRLRAVGFQKVEFVGRGSGSNSVWQCGRGGQTSWEDIL